MYFCTQPFFRAICAIGDVVFFMTLPHTALYACLVLSQK
jgi:hypothetical protein